MSEFGMDALRRLWEKEKQQHLIDVPPDAPMEEPGATMHAWNGEKFIPWAKWEATEAIVRIEPPEKNVLATEAPRGRRGEKRNGRRVEAAHLFAPAGDDRTRIGDDELALDGGEPERS